MAEAILLSGKRGEGKSLGGVRMIGDYVRRGRTVATNMDLYLEHLAPAASRVVCYRLPDHPTVDDLEALPLGNPDPTKEGRNGLLVLDECATFLNSREWQKKDRLGLIAWLAQSRKKGWDLLLLLQHPRMLDAQIREALCELFATARRLDKMAVPFLSGPVRWLTGRPLKMPQLHVITMRYGSGAQAPIADRWMFRGADYYKAYNTLQKIDPLVGQVALSSYLPAWHLRGRYLSRWNMVRGFLAVGGLLGFVVGVAVGALWPGEEAGVPVVETAAPVVVDESTSVVGVVDEGGRFRVILADGRVGLAEGSRFDGRGVLYQLGGAWYRGVK